MKSDTDIFYSQSQVSREFESGIDVKYLISLIEVASDTYNRQKINASKFSLFLSTSSFPQLFYPLMTRQFFCDFHEKSEDFCVS